MTSIYDFTVLDAEGTEISLKDYEGKALLIVNVASKCGLTPQYEGLQSLYEQFHDDGLEILGFPCNQFKGQEPGTDAEIQEFCSTNYNVTFPVLAKIDINGPTAHPLYQFLRTEAACDFGPSDPRFETFSTIRGDAIGTDEVIWNFAKFLVARDGTVTDHFSPSTLPADLEGPISTALKS